MTNETRVVPTELLPCPFCGSEPVPYDNGYATCPTYQCALNPLVIRNELWNKRAQPADQQGEPGYRCHKCGLPTPPPQPYKLYVNCECGATTAATAAACHVQPATAKVVLPERMRESSEDSDVFTDLHDEGWNACLDEIAKLNGGEQ